MSFSLAYVIVSSALFLSPAEAAARTLVDRQAAGECATSNSGNVFQDGRITDPLPSDTAVQGDLGISSADNIEIMYGSNFKVLYQRYSKEAYVLTQCGTQQPSTAQVNTAVGGGVPADYTVKHFEIPLQVVGAETTVVLEFFQILGVADRVKFISQYASGACWGKALGCSAEIKANRTAQLPEVDAWFMDCSGQPCTNLNSESKGVHVSATQDLGPLHTAEHIKFVAAFFNKEKVASQYFTAQAALYTSLASSFSTQPVVAWISHNTWGSTSYQVSQAIYKMKMVEHAGGVNVNGTALMERVQGMTKTAATTGDTYTIAYTGDANKASAAQALFTALEALGVTAVIDESWTALPAAYTMDNFYQIFNLSQSSNLGFLTGQMVLRFDGTLGEARDGGNPGWSWYEARIARPASAAEGLARVLHKDSSKQKWFFRNIAIGETPTVVPASACAESLPVCNADSYPEVIVMMDGSEVSQAPGVGMTLFGLFSALLVLALSQ